MIAVSLNVALSNRQNCTYATNTLQTRRGRTHGAGCVRPWFHTAEPLGERRYENWITHISQLSDNSLPPFISWEKGYRKDDYTVDCPHLIKKRLSKTRVVDFHLAKLAISEILLSYFQGIGDSIVSGRKFYYEKDHSNFSVVCVCEWGGGGEGGGGAELGEATIRGKATL